MPDESSDPEAARCIATVMRLRETCINEEFISMFQRRNPDEVRQKILEMDWQEMCR